MRRAGRVLAPAMILLRDQSGGVTAMVSPRAASLRSLTVGGIDLVEPTAHHLQPPGMSGAVLVPWPNRVEDAEWHYEGQTLRLALTEPALGHALHGLLAGHDFTVGQRTAGSVALRARIDPSPGYPFRLEVVVGYHVLDDGVGVAVVVENRGTGTAPVAVGAHPYLRVAAWATDDLTVAIDADHEWDLDARHIPRHRYPVPRVGPPRAPHRIEDLPRHALYEADPGSTDGLIHAVSAPDGRRVELHADPGLRWTQLYIEPALDTEDGTRRAVAIEPMSAPPNALRTGTDLRLLDHGESARWTWRIRLG